MQRKTMFGFEELAVHRGRTVDEVIADAVAAYLERSNFNNIADIASLLASVGLTGSLVKPFAGDLSTIIARRHAIVHRADLDLPNGHEITSLQPIDSRMVDEWLRATENFGQAVLDDLFRPPSVGQGGHS